MRMFDSIASRDFLSFGDESCVPLFKFHKRTVDGGKEGIRDPFLFSKERKRDGTFLNGRSYGFFLPEVFFLFCRPQTSWRMIHKSVIYGGADFLPSFLFPPRTPPEQIDPVDRAFRGARKQRRDDKSSRKSSEEGSCRAIRTRSAQRRRHGANEKFVNATRAGLHEYCIASCGQYDGGAHIRNSPSRVREVSELFSACLTSWLETPPSSSLQSRGYTTPPGVYIARGFYGS